MNTLNKALEKAFHINMMLPVCPVTKECSEKYPQVDLLGKYSIVDTAFEYRTLLIRSACQNQPELVQNETNLLLASAKSQQYRMRQAASMLHNLELAGVLYELSDTSDYKDMRKQLLELPVLKDYHKSITAAEHMAGLKDTEISMGLRSYCSDVLEHHFSMTAYHLRHPMTMQEAAKLLPPPDKKHQEICRRYSSPATLKATLHSHTKNGPAL